MVDLAESIANLSFAKSSHYIIISSSLLDFFSLISLIKMYRNITDLTYRERSGSIERFAKDPTESGSIANLLRIYLRFDRIC